MVHEEMIEMREDEAHVYVFSTAWYHIGLLPLGLYRLSVYQMLPPPRSHSAVARVIELLRTTPETPSDRYHTVHGDFQVSAPPCLRGTSRAIPNRARNLSCGYHYVHFLCASALLSA